jgi:hypothetical protein
MRSLPALRYELAERRNARVNIGYHVEHDRRFYGVPHPLVHERVEVRATVVIVEIFLSGERVTSHRRSYGPPVTAVTDPGHWAQNHQSSSAAMAARKAAPPSSSSACVRSTTNLFARIWILGSRRRGLN